MVVLSHLAAFVVWCDWRNSLYLTQRMDDPPSLVELARKVGINDYKLKVGFREVFGTTVYKYLHTHRM